MNSKLPTMMWSGLLAAGLMITMPAARAQDEGGEKPKKERREGVRGQRVEMLRERLGLTDAQVEQLKPILAAEREEMLAKRKELGRDADRETIREAARAVHQSYIPKIEAVLTPEQREKWAEMRERRADRAGKKGGAEDAG